MGSEYVTLPSCLKLDQKYVKNFGEPYYTLCSATLSSLVWKVGLFDLHMQLLAGASRQELMGFSC